MTSTLTEIGAFDALDKALPGEPLFPLLAHDPDAPATITEWARLRRNRAFKLYGTEPANDQDAKLLAAELQQCKEAEGIALTFIDWRIGHTAVASTERATYQQVERTEEEIAAAEALTKRQAAVRHFREAAYHLSEARDGLDGMGLLGEATLRQIVMMLAAINGLAVEFTPTRPGAEAQLALPEPAGEAQ